jgi:hypothetical protein
MRFLSLISVILLIGFVSCKKDRLDGDRSILEGKWEWIYAIRTEVHTNGAQNTIDTIKSDQIASNYALEFTNKGKFKLIEDNEVKENYRIVFFSFGIGGGTNFCSGSVISNQEKYYYAIHPDDDDSNSFDGCVSSDSLTSYSMKFPFEGFDEGLNLIYFQNVYKKIN